ncbi:hypothetical protein Tco_0910718 [Tanacetum coccineum]|uniref:Uncharacterized protein n=1 Tax=Tanacetum coccineum TaxID=301880 RepID=A0ABQ5CU59_9ASTR
MDDEDAPGLKALLTFKLHDEDAAEGFFGDIVRVCGPQMVRAFREVHDKTRATGSGPKVINNIHNVHKVYGIRSKPVKQMLYIRENWLQSTTTTTYPVPLGRAVWGKEKYTQYPKGLTDLSTTKCKRDVSSRKFSRRCDSLALNTMFEMLDADVGHI